MQGTRLSCSALACLALAGCAAWLSGCSSGPVTIPARTFGMGEKVLAGHITYTVFETQWLTHLGEGLDARVPQNRFLLVRLTAVNGGGSDANIPNFTIVDDNGNSFDELSNGTDVPQWIGYLRSAHPADYVQGNILFDAPAAHYKLHLADDTGTYRALVDMPLSFNADAPPEMNLPTDLGQPPIQPGRN